MNDTSITPLPPKPDDSLVSSSVINLTCVDGIHLTATLFKPNNVQPGIFAPAVLISSATGVPQTFYARMATYLVEQGAPAVLTYDYRGMSQSTGNRADWPNFTMLDWATKDMVTAAQKLQKLYPEIPMVGLGHSFGGQALGLCGISSAFQRYCSVASMSGYWKNTDEPWSILTKTALFGAPISKVLGALPGSIGVGETMPGTIYRQWARWIRRKEYFFGDPKVSETKRFLDVRLPYLSIGIEDDPWGTKAAIYGLTKHYVNADIHQIWLKPDEQTGKIGHLGLFRQRHKNNHWPVVRDFLLSGQYPKS